MDLLALRISIEYIIGNGSKRFTDHGERAMHACVAELYAKVLPKVIFASGTGNRLTISVAHGCAWSKLIEGCVLADASVLAIIENLRAQVDKQTV